MSTLNGIGRLPTPPMVVLRLIELTRRPETTVAEIASVLSMDPGLSAKILRFCNSPLAGMRREVTSLHQAVSMMGLRGVEMTALSFCVVCDSRIERCLRFDHARFAVQSVVCGVAAKILASKLEGGPSPQEAFIAGLLSQIGRLVFASALPDEYTNVLARVTSIPRQLPPSEREKFGTTYPRVGAELLRMWSIPEVICHAIESFRDVATNAEAATLAKVLYVGEIVADFVFPVTKGDSNPLEFLSDASRLLGLDQERTIETISEITLEVEQARQLLEIPATGIRKPEDLEAEIRERIAELSMAMHLENQEMAMIQEDLVRRASTDGLTGIGNRTAFDARLALEIERSMRNGGPLALILIDIDKFKNFNDAHGHQVGDYVLRSVARVIDENARKVDFVARFGGEEFAVIVPEATDKEALFFAERFRLAVERASFQWESRPLSVTISVGVNIVSRVDGKQSPDVFVRTADERLYQAKQNGRNRVEGALDMVPIAQLA